MQILGRLPSSPSERAPRHPHSSHTPFLPEPVPLADIVYIPLLIHLLNVCFPHSVVNLLEAEILPSCSLLSPEGLESPSWRMSGCVDGAEPQRDNVGSTATAGPVGAGDRVAGAQLSVTTQCPAQARAQLSLSDICWLNK